MAQPSTPRRMAPEDRRAQLLGAARSVLARDGLERFSLEDVAREAGVALTLPRHYFESRDGLLVAVLLGVLHELTDPLIAPDPPLPMDQRLRIYIGHLAENTWGHALWLKSANLHPDLDAAARAIRRRLIEASYGRRWEDMTPEEQLKCSGWLGYVNAVVAEWIEQGAEDQEQLLAAILDGAWRLEAAAG
jgi:AcrR family transcriptional regulator